MGVNGNQGATAGAKTVTVMVIHPNFKTVTVTVTVIFRKLILKSNKTAGNNFDSNGTVSGGAIQTLAWVLSWARPGQIPGPRWSRPDSPCALFYSVSDPFRSRGGGHPGPSWSHPAPEPSFQDRAWTGRNRLPSVVA